MRYNSHISALLGITIKDIESIRNGLKIVDNLGTKYMIQSNDKYNGFVSLQNRLIPYGRLRDLEVLEVREVIKNRDSRAFFSIYEIYTSEGKSELTWEIKKIEERIPPILITVEVSEKSIEPIQESNSFRTSDKKYEIVKEYTTRTVYGYAYRVRALKDFSDVKKGDLGGYINSYGNLDQKGDCWIYNDAMCIGDSIVQRNAKLKDKVIVEGNCLVSNDAVISDNCRILGKCVIGRRNNKIFTEYEKDNTSISGNVYMNGDILVGGSSSIKGNTELIGSHLIINRCRINSDKDIKSYRFNDYILTVVKSIHNNFTMTKSFEDSKSITSLCSDGESYSEWSRYGFSREDLELGLMFNKINI
ncbi:hypothetical protein D3C81_899550 [compost metagenome]